MNGIRVLGAVTVHAGDLASASPSLRLSTLLSLLVLTPGRRVDDDVLVDGLWEEDLPRYPRKALQVYASRLRRWLGVVEDDWPLVDDRKGYRLDIDPAEVDLHRFHRADDRRLESVDTALKEWRGEPFGGCVISSVLSSERERARQRYLRLAVRRAELLVDDGRVDEALGALAGLRAEHPADEGLAIAAMTALYLAGRQTDALAVYDATRRHLAEEFGLDPSAELVALHRRLLDHRLEPSRAVVSTSPVVGRDDVLAALLGRVGGPGALVLVEGGAGMGKTSVLHALVDAARARGAHTGTGAWDEGGTPLSGWREALTPLGLGRVASRGPLVQAGLADLGRARPVVLTLDDLHLADATSFGILRTLVRLGLPARVLLVGGVRHPDTRERSGWLGVLADLARQPCLHRVALPALTGPAVRALAAVRLRTLTRTALDRVADAVARRSGGHPLHASALLEILDGVDEEQALTRVGDVPDRLRPLFDLQLSGLPRRTRRAVEALAVLEPVDTPGLAAAVGSPVLDLVDDLRPAVDVGIVEAIEATFRTRHALLAEAVRDAVPTAARAQLHLVRWQGLPADAEAFTRLRHALGAAAVLEPAQVADARRLAGHAAYRRGAVAEALDLFDAAAAGVPAADLADVVVHRGLVLAALGRTNEADTVLDAVLDDLLDPAPDGSGPADLAVLAALGDDRLGAAAGGSVRRLGRLRRVDERLAHHPRHLDVVRARVAEETLVHGDVVTPGLATRFAATLAAVPVAAAPSVLAETLLVAAARLVEAPVAAGERLAAARAALDAATRTGDPLRVLYASELLMSAALAAGDLDLARDTRSTVAEEGRRWYRPRSMWSAMLLDAALALAEGRAEQGDTLAAAALAAGRQWGVPDAVGAHGVHLLTRHWLAGTLAELGDLPGRFAAHYPHIAAWSAAAAVAAVHAGDADGAQARLREFRRRRADNPGRTVDRPGLCLAAAAAFAVDDRATADLVRTALPADPDAGVVVGVGAAVFGPVTLYTALCDHVLGDDPKPGLAAAAATAQRHGWTPWEEVAVVLARSPEEPLPLGLGGTRGR